MATLKHAKFSMEGEQPQAETAASHAEQSIIADLKNGSETLSTSKYHVFKLVQTNRKGGVYIPNIDDVYNPETQKVERMRLLSGVSSVWLKDQKDLSPEYVRQNSRSLCFARGTRMIQISEYDQAALTFARLCNSNIGNKKRISGSRFEFYEYDPAREEKEAFEREDFELEMALVAKQAKAEDMTKHAAFLGIRLINDLGLPKGEDGIRIEYVRYAKRNPKYFKDTLGSDEVNIAWLVRKGVVDSKIEIGREPGKIFWANGGGMICVLPNGEDAIRWMTNLALTNSDDGKRFLGELQTRIN